MTIRQLLIDEITKIISKLNEEIHNQVRMGRNNLLLDAEEIYGNILNIVLGLNLEGETSPNSPIDLADHEKKLAVRITATPTSQKIFHILERFIGTQLHLTFDRLIILIIGPKKPRTLSIPISADFDFDPETDVWNETRLLGAIITMDLETLKELRDYLHLKSPRNVLPRSHFEISASHLDRIILGNPTSGIMINEEKLRDTTIPCTIDFLTNTIDLTNVQHLYIIASPNQDIRPASPSLSEGCYISLDNTWLLLYLIAPRDAKTVIAQCQNAAALVICHHSLDMLPLDHCRGLSNLKIISNAVPIGFTSMRFLSTLRDLDINGTEIDGELDLRTAVHLRTLRLSDDDAGLDDLSIGTGIFHEVSLVRIIRSTPKLSGLDWCRELEFLELRNALIDEVDLDRLQNLKTLALVGMDANIRVKSTCGSLSELYLVGCKVESLAFLPQLTSLKKLVAQGLRSHDPGIALPDLHHIANLESISLIGTKLHSVGTLPPQLSHLNLSYTGLIRIPDSVKPLKNLMSLELCGLQMRELPPWLADLHLPVLTTRSMLQKGILLESAKVDGIKLDTIPQQPELLAQWLEAFHDSQDQTQNEVKVVFLGDGEAGKSHIIKRLENDGAMLSQFDGDSTPGIAITSKQMELTNRRVTLRIWDFGGQEILHAMHRIFMTEQTLYVVVLNARNDTQDHRAEHWLRFIYSFDQDAQVMLVLNKTDQNPRASININRLKRIFPGLSEPLKMSAKKDTPELFADNFINPLRKRLEQFEPLRSPFPKSWRTLEDKLLSIDTRYIFAEVYDEFCEEVGITSPEVRNELLSRFMNMGICFRSDGDLGDAFLLLEPKWVTNAIYKLLFNHYDQVSNGVIHTDDIKACLSQGNQRQTLDQNLSYTRMEVGYILDVMRSCGLSFDLDSDGKEFIPMLCDRNESPLVKKYAEDPTVLEIWWQFDYLPENLLFHLMVELSNELDTDHVWLQGAQFSCSYSNHSIILVRDGHTLKLYAMNDREQGLVRQHMEAMERSIRKVIDAHFPGMVQQQENPGASATSLITRKKYPGIQRLLVHKLNGKRETFDLDRLDSGPTYEHTCTYYSKLLNAPVSGMHLLERCYRGMDPEQGLLIQNIVEACMCVQANPSQRENPRNTYVRDILAASKRYDVRDQTLCGKAEGKTEAGELDMEIRRDPGTAWTVFEALNNADYDYWRRHLNKLLINYNPHGLKMLFLVVYVDNVNFVNTVAEYVKLIKTHSPEGFACIPESAEDLTELFAKDANGASVWRCIYESGTGPMTVYHIFIHMNPANRKRTSNKSKAEPSSTE